MTNDNIIGIRIIEGQLYNYCNLYYFHDTAYRTCGEITLYANYLAKIYSYIVSKSKETNEETPYCKDCIEIYKDNCV